METSVKAAEVLAPPQPDVASSEGAEGEATAPPPAACSSSDFFNPMEEFSRRLEDIISTYGSAASVLDRQQSQAEAETEKRKETKEDVAVSMETEVSHIKQSLNKLCSPEDKLEALVRKYAELSALRRCDEKKLCVLQQRLSVLQADGRSSVAARSKLETLCRELQGHYCQLREETLQRCKEEEEKKTEMANHFQTMLTEIQAQIEQHSARNDKLCHENTNLTDKLESLMNQYELREQSLEKINKHRDLQHKLTEAKLQQANALLSEAEEKHKREKEYLLREAIDKTKKCFAMKEQELAMKKKLTLYAQKFDEFQETLAKSNQIYTRFKKEMENMSEKMKKMDKESNLWKTRFENCNKALTDMMEERLEKSKEYDLFVLKIQKLEKLCRALQDERVILYEKIKEVRHTNSNISSKVFSSSNLPDPEGAETSALLSPEELQEIQDEDPVLTKDMSRLREEQAKLQQFAASLLATPLADDEEKNDDVDREEDLMASAFVHFKTKTQVKTEQVREDRPEAAEPVCPQAGEEAPDVSSPEAPTHDVKPADTKPEGEQVQTQVENREEQPAEPANKIQQQPAEPTPEPEEAKTEAPADPEPEPEPAPAELPVQAAEAKPVNPVETQKVQTEPAQEEEAPTKSESTPPTRVSSSEDTPKTSAEDTLKTSAEDTPKTSAEDTPKTSATSNGDSSKKHTPKKKKKRNNKNAS